MIRSFLIGLPAGARAMTPLAAVTDAARRGALAADRGAPLWLGRPAVATVAKLLAAGEIYGDKLKSAPDRIVPAGLLARIVSGGIAGAAVAPRRHAVVGGLLGATAAVGAAYLTFYLRIPALRRYGQTPTGVIEDALTVAATQAVLVGAGPPR